MMIRFALTLVVGLMLSVSGTAWGTTNTSSLPACPSNLDAYWHNCFGTYTFGSKSEWAGDQYVGEYRDNKKHGRGTYTYASGDKYVGEYKDGKRNGQGTYTTADRNVRIIRDA